MNIGNMNVGVPNSVPSYHKMTVEEYKDMSFVPTKANLEKRQLEHAKAMLQSQQQEQRKPTSYTSKDPFSSATSTSPQEQAKSLSISRPEIGRLSGNFNAPTHIEVKRHKDTKRSRSLSKMIKRWMKRSPPTIA